MKIYLAPMEGITGNIYRANLHRVFGGVDRFFTPFITPCDKGGLSTKIYNDILPDNNKGTELIPQILTDNAAGFVSMSKRLAEFGYEEFNLNLGCPSGTVVSKGRGSGFLAFPDKLDAFLEEIFDSGLKISVKTRIGKEDPDEFYRLLEIYEKYPLTELIIHPRTRTDMYNNTPNLDMYAHAEKNSRHSLCYNGDIRTVEDAENIALRFPKTTKIMVGRGVVANPALPALIKGITKPSAKKLREFYNGVYEDYSKVLYGSTNLLHKMKELMLYMATNFEDNEKIIKKLKKAKNLSVFNACVNELFEEHRLLGEDT
ncbi:MAG: tRNA-dihydrouridine synthase family protein [Firmicutes bacterium]|nr:tRNA-dihydrouridine synthase family protein [Bacillota bacterium]MBQ9605042.1 tRNA-dihydrouridine synthase family protein [Bacillota bacterium]